MFRSSLSVLIVVLCFSVSAPASDPDWSSKVEAGLLSSGQSGPVEFIVYLDEQADLGVAESASTKAAKGEAVFQALTATARQSQGPVREELETRAVEHRPFWIANMIWARGLLDDIRAMAERSDVRRIYANPWVRLDGPWERSAAGDDASPAAVEWNVLQVNADDVWALGNEGEGIVIGGQDTGYDWDHPALLSQYRGWNGVSVDHDYNWHDAIHSGGGVCGPDSSEPCDDYDHGTHTMGTAVGDDGGSNQIGVAPGAQWIGCRNMDVGNGSPASYSECYQFFMAPTDLNDENPDPSKAPDVIINSWTCTYSEGCTEPDILLEVVENVRAAGIVTVHSAGNSGPSCSTISEPSAIYAESFTVGATDFDDAIGSLSSRGPVTVDGSSRRKPDVTAPGISIRSCVPGGGYESGWSGTSMAGPHVAGVIALVLSGTPVFRGQVGAIEYIVEQSALPLTTSQGCGGDGPDEVPNNTFGWGRVDALAAHLMAVGSPIFEDGFESGDTSAWSYTQSGASTGFNGS